RMIFWSYYTSAYWPPIRSGQPSQILAKDGGDSYSVRGTGSCVAGSDCAWQQRSSQDRNTRKGTSPSLRLGQTSQYASRKDTACSKTGTSRPSDISFWAR